VPTTLLCVLQVLANRRNQISTIPARLQVCVMCAINCLIGKRRNFQLVLLMVPQYRMSHVNPSRRHSADLEFNSYDVLSGSRPSPACFIIKHGAIRDKIFYHGRYDRDMPWETVRVSHIRSEPFFLSLGSVTISRGSYLATVSPGAQALTSSEHIIHFRIRLRSLRNPH
jgi:hypothetical protein